MLLTTALEPYGTYMIQHKVKIIRKFRDWAAAPMKREHRAVAVSVRHSKRIRDRSCIVMLISIRLVRSVQRLVRLLGPS